MTCPLGQFLKMQLLSLMGKGQRAGKEHGGLYIVFCAVFVVPHQRIPPAGKLHPNLVASAGVEPDTHQAGIALFQLEEFQPGGLYSLALPVYNKYLVFGRIFP